MGAFNIPVILGSTRRGRQSPKVARFIQRRLAERDGIESDVLDLAEYDLPIMEERLRQRDDPPPGLTEFSDRIARADALVIVTPEYNASVPPLLKNTLDWVSRVKEKPDVFRSRVFAISGTSPGYYGAMRSLLQLREILSIGLGALVIPQQMALPRSVQAFGDDGSLQDDNQQKMFAGVVEALAVAARRFAS